MPKHSDILQAVVSAEEFCNQYTLAILTQGSIIATPQRSKRLGLQRKLPISIHNYDSSWFTRAMDQFLLFMESGSRYPVIVREGEDGKFNIEQYEGKYFCFISALERRLRKLGLEVDRVTCFEY